MGPAPGVFVSLFFLSIIDTVLSLAQCGSTLCEGYSAYCCSYAFDECCYHYVYHFWWFWFVWVLIFTMIASCSICCYRRRRRSIYRSDYAVVTDGYRPPAYGTVVSVSSAPPPYPQQQATAPPQYQPDQKPPAYVP